MFKLKIKNKGTSLVGTKFHFEDKQYKVTKFESSRVTSKLILNGGPEYIYLDSYYSLLEKGKLTVLNE